MGTEIDWDSIAKAVVDFHTDFRQPMFSGFLTLAGFLFAVKSFSLVNLVKEVYNTPEYRAIVNSNRENGQPTTIYGPLTGLAFVLRLGIYFCLGTAVIQFVGGKQEHWSIAVLGIFSSIFSIGFVVYAIWRLQENINKFIGFLENVGEEKMKSEAEEAKKTRKSLQ